MPMIGIEPTTYCLRDSCSTSELHRLYKIFNFFDIDLILYLKELMSKIDPELRKKLLKESQTPFKGLRKIIWIACAGSAYLGLFIMLSQIAGGNGFQQNNFLIQLGACIIFPILLFLDRDK